MSLGGASVVVVEDLRDGTPTRPGRQHLLLVRGGGTALSIQLAQHRQRGDVGPGPALRALGHNRVARRWAPPRRARRLGPGGAGSQIAGLSGVAGLSSGGR